ncbi:hypothetical protein FGG79_10235 [Bacillus sp. BHET2]|uniref:hypothetical protein n=1 Tax=Bacillus sp. BHET2 TaxID=2583818 RepID=UPI00110D3F9E|nr:hypothetical protein [Bacillus sp. BHET2]TMU85587.1 hypothetical protein FGG79_10235 [Bacillus sp. BHET2]
MESLIIFILIGLITTIFKKVKEPPSTKPTRQKPIQTASPPQPSPPSEREGRESSRPKESRGYKKPLKETSSSIQAIFEEKKKEAETYKKLQEQEERFSKKIEAHQTQAKTIRETGSPLSINFKNEDDIVKGFIFSEVFGPPRSKKRHHQK